MIGNRAGAVAAGVLVLLCQACDRTPPASRPTDSAATREAAPAAPGPASKPEAGQTAETATPPRAEPPKAPASAPPVKPTVPDRVKQPASQTTTPPTPAAPTPASPTPAEPAPPTPTPTSPPPAAQTPAPPPPTTPVQAATLDLSSLEKRLRETKAIGVFTKLSLKNEVDDLLEQFREFHRSPDQSSRAKLRQAYDLLLLKVLSLLQDGDPGLARDVSSSREALWSILVDPDKFKNL